MRVCAATPCVRSRPMIRIRHLTTAALGLALIVGGCAQNAGAPTWTYPPAPAVAAAAGGSPDAQPAMDMGSAAPGSPAPTGNAIAAGGEIAIEAFDLGYKLASSTVAVAGSYPVTFTNTGSTTHDVTFADGTKLTADAGATVKGTVNVPAAGIGFLCSIPGHAAAGMTGKLTVAGAAPAASAAPPTSATSAAPVADPNAPPYVLRDATAPAVMPGTVHDVDFPIIEKDITVAKGLVVHAWTFGGTVPGPTLRVHLGDTVRVHLTNQGSMSHSI